MSYYPRGRGGDDDVDDFDEYDSTPYGGGYDQALTYGRPLSPSDEICYPSSSSGAHNDFDYDRPSYTSSAQPSAYSSDALDNEYKSYSRPKPRPANPGGPGYQPHLPTPPGGDDSIEYGGRPTVYGSGPVDESGLDYGSGYPGRKKHNEYDAPPPSSDYGSGYGGRKSEYETPPSSDYGSGYGGRKSEYETPPSSEYGSGYGGGRKNEYDAPPSSEYGSGYGGGRKNEYDAPPSSGYGSGYGGRKNESEYEAPDQGYGRKTTGYNEPSSEYGSGYEKQSGYGGSSYGRKSDDDDDGKPRYGRNKYGDNDSDDDEKKKHYHHHHNRGHYDD